MQIFQRRRDYTGWISSQKFYVSYQVGKNQLALHRTSNQNFTQWMPFLWNWCMMMQNPILNRSQRGWAYKAKYIPSRLGSFKDKTMRLKAISDNALKIGFVFDPFWLGFTHHKKRYAAHQLLLCRSSPPSPPLLRIIFCYDKMEPHMSPSIWRKTMLCYKLYIDNCFPCPFSCVT